MRILHTSDWHLGRRLAGEALLGEQEYILRQVIDAVREYRPQLVAIAGDVYDRAVPPPEAVELLDETLSTLVLDCKTEVVLIAGNHDSPQRLTFASKLLARNHLHIAGAFDGGNRVRTGDEWGPVDVFALPYLEPALAREELDEPEITDHDGAARAMVARIRESDMAPRSVLLAHAFIAGGEVSDSERPLTMAGAGTVNPDAFDGITYVALGHLHRAQRAGRESMQYSGSILKYSFAECDHEKSLTLVDMDAAGNCVTTRLPLRPRRDVRRIEGMFDALLQSAPSDDLLQVTLQDATPIYEPLARLREVFPNVLAIEQPNFLAARGAARTAPAKGLTDAELFDAFFSQVTGSNLTAEEQAELIGIIDSQARQEREG